MSLIPLGFWGKRNYITEELKLYYDFASSSSYPGSGSTVFNLAKNDFNGTINGATFDSVDSGGCFSFNGTTARIEPSPLSFFNNEIWGPNQSYEIWFKTSSTTGMRLMSFFDTLGSVPTARYIMSINLNNVGGTNTGYITTSIGDNNDVVFKQRVPSAHYNTGVSNGSWHQLVSVHQNLTSYVSNLNFSTQARIYVDGVEVSPYTLYAENTQNNGGIVFGNVDYNFWIGGGNSRGVFSVPFNGKIGVVRVYKKGLTGSEVLLNFNQYKNRYGL